jgi:peptidoglycan/LPS O-acetylase OafA/YrhL
MRRVPELDALRAIAAAIVLLFHLRPPKFAFGSTGVDLFFVLSGYLITTIILRSHGTPWFVLNFYARRGLRIWPIYYLTLFALLALNPHLPRPEPTDGLPYYLTYTQNSSYYRFREPLPFIECFRHTWTLALEEQFYLIWPGLAILAGRRLIGLCVGVVLIALMARAGGYFSFGSYNQMILIGRCDGFALGGLLAALLADRDRLTQHLGRFRLGFGLLSLAAGSYIAWGIIRHTQIGFLGLPTPSWPASTIFAVNLFYFALIGLVALFAGCRALAPLRLGVLVYLGQISYGIYMYHYPVYWLLDGGRFRTDRAIGWDVLKVTLTLALAVASWHLVERPILGLKERFRYGARPGAVEAGRS